MVRELVCPRCGRIGTIRHEPVTLGPLGRSWAPFFRCRCGWHRSDQTVVAVVEGVNAASPPRCWRHRIGRWWRRFCRGRGWIRQPDAPIVMDEASKRTRLEVSRRRAARMKAREKEIGPNDPCPCGSGKRFKKCCR